LYQICTDCIRYVLIVSDMYWLYQICTDCINAGSVYFLKHAKLKVKVKFTLKQTTKAQRGS